MKSSTMLLIAAAGVGYYLYRRRSSGPALLHETPGAVSTIPPPDPSLVHEDEHLSGYFSTRRYR